MPDRSGLNRRRDLDTDAVRVIVTSRRATLVERHRLALSRLNIDQPEH